MLRVIGNQSASTDGGLRKIISFIAAILFLPVFLHRSGIFTLININERGFIVSLLIIIFCPLAAFTCKSETLLLLLIAAFNCVFILIAAFGMPYSEQFSITLTMSYLSALFVVFSAYSLIKRLEASATPEHFFTERTYRCVSEQKNNARG